MHYDEEDELTMEEDKNNRLNKMYAVRVYKTLGLMHLVIILAILFCYVILFLPASILFGYESINKLITFLSRGSSDWEMFYWSFFISLTTLVAILIIVLTVKDKLYETHKKKKNKQINKSKIETTLN